MTQGDLFCWVVTVCACIGLTGFTGWAITCLASDVKKRIEEMISGKKDRW
ncbi:hypothetical protein SELR_pSRC400770 (plasmid) [Selenomonas ruminantium subsp. lactilytica TAM6421]|uniref:Uncharacterized protein n=1 Tax=Selenomonas ruminantium subsp. lactilytica (strain NBRC 103574 / TAM6421) TaxID=927704 RepID=I0GVE1_SELRL|nr:hypothetical protein SELR_pSRC400770 [Selenomonas ruminantium subsp. lactilytica TAM6421]